MAVKNVAQITLGKGCRLVVVRRSQVQCLTSPVKDPPMEGGVKDMCVASECYESPGKCWELLHAKRVLSV